MKNRDQLVLKTCILLLSAGVAFAQDLKITEGPVVEHTSGTSAMVAWSTNAPSSTLVKYGTAPNNLNAIAQTPWGSLTHRVTIKNLAPGTTYYFQVISGQAQGTDATAMSKVAIFRTEGEAAAARAAAPSPEKFRITYGPILERLGDTSAIIAWSTNVPSSSTVHYGTDPNNLVEIAQEPWGATAHRVELNNLRPGTRYYFRVHSAQGQNAPGQTANAGPIAFTTAVQGQEASAQSH